MHLTKEEQAIIDGHQGEGASIAMKVLVGIGQVFDASRLVPIRRAHVSLSNQEGDTWFAEKLQKAGAKCLVPPTVNPGYCMDFFLSKGLLSNEDIDSMRRCHEAYKNLGAQMNYSCTPHLLENVPLLGEVVAYSESSATVFINSVCGARSNRESSQSALCAAIVGRVPEYGLLLDENRRAQALIKVEADLSDDFFYSILGWLTPKKIDNLIPVYSGIRERPTPEALINLGTELNVTGAIPMFHIAGFTPEAPSEEAALGGRKPKLKIKVTNSDITNQLDSMFHPPGPIDFVMFGCPHYTLNQVKKVAALVEGKKVKTELWILTSFHTLEMARRTGLLEIIETAGGQIVPDTCVDQPCWRHLEGKVGATDSPKCAYYCNIRNMNFIVRSLRECIEGAVRGEVR